jgi:hypothetical protein
MKRTTTYVNRAELKVKRRATGLATSHNKQPGIKMDRRATQHTNIYKLKESSRDEARDAARRLNNLK